MPRIALGLEYDGAEFCGWQRQPAGRSVQACLEDALTRVADHPVTVHCAGRTDAGVHATGQVAHFDTASERTLRGWQLGANGYLPSDVSVMWARVVPDDFHARFSARARTYLYRIINQASRTALHRTRACWVPRSLDTALMCSAAAHLLGRHDFSAFRAAECQAKTTVRTLQRLQVEREGAWITIEACADAFLHHMVRNIAGVLIRVGAGDAPPEWAGEVLAGRDRRAAGVTAAASGLYLIAVAYDPELALPSEHGIGMAAGLSV
jgi:tRNA pseudouridine38-40 synthase